MLADGGDEFNRYMQTNMDTELIDNAEFHNRSVNFLNTIHNLFSERGLVWQCVFTRWLLDDLRSHGPVLIMQHREISIDDPSQYRVA